MLKHMLKMGSHRGGLRQLLRWKCVERRGILIISIGFIIIIIDVFMPLELNNPNDTFKPPRFALMLTPALRTVPLVR